MGLRISDVKSSSRSLSTEAKITVAGPADLFKSKPFTSRKLKLPVRRRRRSFWLRPRCLRCRRLRCRGRIFSVESWIMFLRSAISPLASAKMTSSPTFGLPTATIKSPGTVFPSRNSSSFAKPITVKPAPVCTVSKLSSVFSIRTWSGSKPRVLASRRMPSKISLPVGSFSTPKVTDRSVGNAPVAITSIRRLLPETCPAHARQL